MEEKNKPFASRLEAFLAGKGFYIVLFVCVGIIGLSAWSMMSGKAKTGSVDMAVSNMEDETVAAETAVGETAETVVPTAAPVTIPELSPEAVVSETVPESVETLDYFIWPVAGTVENGYSMDALVFHRTMQDWRTHDGLDVAAELGTQVKAAANGTVAEIREDDLLGTTVVLSHRDGLVSMYSNLAATPAVSVGQHVNVGQVIGAVGDTAIGEAGEVCHLHFAMALDGESVDPGDYLP